MAAVNTNTVPIIFEAGGSITINDGTDTATLFCIEPGTLEWWRGGRDPRTWYDRDTPQTPKRGIRRYSGFRIQVKHASAASPVVDLTTLLGADPNQSSQKTFEVIIQIPDYEGATTGKRYTFPTAFLMSEIRHRAGEQFDLTEFEMNDKVNPTEARY